jgi:allantoin racemase
MPRLCFLNPFGTNAYDELIASTLLPSLRGSTEVEIRHLAHAPRDIDYRPKHLAETEIAAAAVRPSGRASTPS